MQNVEKVAKLLREDATKETNVQALSGNLKVEDKPAAAKLNPAIIVPVPLKRKRFNDELIAELNATYERPAICRDDYGEYKEGAFLHGSNLVMTSIVEGRWHLTVKSDKPLSIYEVKAARYKFIPDDAYMTVILPKRSELEKFTSPHCMQMIEIQVTKNE
ncbi:hypothetical protein [Bacteroides caccae]|uniref:hypothetical protein n=1 Tax=Bacteroides caccae TaxID=47678 RepID=UPI0022AA5873|nr:hypothetical protein [Bacteroides caccae]MCZ2726272.1 hypothetical protein [Bacteroides caccae]